jgi:superfamily II DNA or RNA helicase
LTHTLRPYQLDALSRSKEAYGRGINRQLAVLATGLGKTAIAANLRAHHGFTKPIIFLVHYETLAVQAATAMQRWNPDLRVGVEMAGSYADLDGFYPPQFIVASVPTLGRKGSERIKRFLPGDFAAVIQDECHLGLADSFKRVYKHFGLLEPNPDGMLFLGITATPNRADGQGLRDLFDAIVFDMGIQKGIADGWLCDIRGIRVSGHADLDKVKVRAGEFAQDDLEKAVNTPKRNAIIVKEWYKHAYDRRTIAFTVDVQHALDLAEAFKVHGVAAKAVWGDDPERHEKIRGHKSGEYPIIACAQLLGIGYDDPQVNCIILSAPRKSFVRYAQEVGRGTRISDGKADLLVIDVGDNASRHNLCSISTLLGLPKELDLKGEKYSVAKQKLDRIAAEFPSANVQDIKSLSELKSIAENISLFQPNYPPEIARLSELAWRKSGDGYCLAVSRDLVSITQDLRGDWQIRGRVGEAVAEFSAQNLPGAMNVADRFVLDHGGVKGYLKRETKWRGEPPTEKQIRLARILKLTIPPGATKGAVSAAIDARRIAMNQSKPEPEPYHGEY